MFCLVFFFFNDTATTEIYTLSLHDALPIFPRPGRGDRQDPHAAPLLGLHADELQVRPQVPEGLGGHRSEEHTSELQSRQYLVCRLLLEKKKKNSHTTLYHSTNII